MRYVACVVLASITVGIPACINGDRGHPTDKPAPEPMSDLRAPVEVAADEGYVGVLVPSDTAEITAPFTTDVVEYKVKLGEHVEIGDVIALLDEGPVREQLAIAQAELKAAKATVGQAAASRNAAKAALRREKQGLRDSVSSRADVEN